MGCKYGDYPHVAVCNCQGQTIPFYVLRRSRFSVVDRNGKECRTRRNEWCNVA
jgi:hypothetical protein